MPAKVSLFAFLALACLGAGAFALACLPWIKRKGALRAALPIALLATGSSAASCLAWIRHLSQAGQMPFATDRFSVMLRASPLTPWWFLAACALLWMGLLLIAYQTESASERVRRFFLVLVSGVGALSLLGAGHLLLATIAWQLVAIPLTMACVQKDLLSTHARSLVTVFLADFFSFVLMAMGLAFLFSQYQTLSLDLLLESIQAESQTSDILLYTGTALFMAGLLVRLGGVPFHMVIVDRVQAGSLSVSGFASVFLAFTAAAFAWNFVGDVLRPTLPQWQDFPTSAKSPLA